MMKTEKNEELINRFVEQLEAIYLEYGSKLDEIEEAKQEYHFFEKILKEIEDSKVDFCTSYYTLTEEQKSDFQTHLLNLFKDQEIVDNIMQEIINLYFLKEAGLLDLEETAPQKEVAIENLETLAIKISKFLKDTNIQQLEADDERLTEKLERLVILGSIIEDRELTPIEDIAFVRQVMELIDLSDEEKKALLIEIIQHNISMYQENLRQKQETKKTPAPPVIEDLKTNPVITSECLAKMEELLSRRDVIERIVKIVNDEFTTVIDIHSPSTEDQEQIRSSLMLAKEEMIDTIAQDQTISPEEALAEFFNKYDETLRHKQEIIAKLTETTEPSTLSREEQQQKVAEAFAFLESKQQQVHELSQAKKEKIRQYMLSLYQKVEDRKMMYESQIYETDEMVEQEAAYEIQVYKELLEAVPETDEETYAKVCRKLEEILSCIKPKEIETPKEEEEGHLFFVMASKDESLFEEDLSLDSSGKGIASKYFNEIKNQLLSIEGRSERKLVAEQPVNPGLKSIKKQGVRYTTSGNRTKVFFIPFGKKDAIIVGTSFLAGKDILRDQDKKVKKYQSQIEELKKRLEDPATYEEEKQKAAIIRDKVMQSLSGKELDEMFAERAHPEESKKVK